METTEEKIKNILTDNPIVLFMKGTPQAPQCGFSMQTARALQSCEEKFTSVDVLANPDIRSTLPKVSSWPTFPQVFIHGELIGGCDIIMELFQKGELQRKLQQAIPKSV